MSRIQSKQKPSAYLTAIIVDDDVVAIGVEFLTTDVALANRVVEDAVINEISCVGGNVDTAGCNGIVSIVAEVDAGVPRAGNANLEAGQQRKGVNVPTRKDLHMT